MSETQSTEDVAQEVEQTQDRLSEAVEALAYKKGHVKDDAKEAVAEKKEELRDKAAEKKDELVGAVKDKAADAKEGVASKAEDVKDAVASRLPGGGGEQPGQGADEGVSAKIVHTKDAVASKLEGLKDAVADKLPGAKEGEEDQRVEVIPVDEQGRPPSEDREAASSAADELRGLAGQLRSEGQSGSAELAEGEASELEQSAD